MVLPAKGGLPSSRSRRPEPAVRIADLVRKVARKAMSKKQNDAFRVDVANLPACFPTHLHSPSFWEWLGRTVATFGLLEDTLARAIFAFTGTKRYPPEEIEVAFERWIPSLVQAHSDTLNPLIDKYAAAVRAHPDAQFKNLDDLVAHLREASKIRNAICHGAWMPPNPNGVSELRYFNKKGEFFDSHINELFLRQLQQHATELVVAIVDSVTVMGFQFPGSSGPGIPIR